MYNIGRDISMNEKQGEGSMNKQFLIAEILLKRGLPDFVVKEITAVAEQDLLYLKKKMGIN